MATLQDILGGLPPGLLTPEQQAMAERRARNAGLMNLGFALLQSSQGQRGQPKPSLGQIIGQAGPVGAQAYQQSFDQTLKGLLLKQQMADAQRKREREQRMEDANRQFIEQISGAVRTVPTGTGAGEQQQQALMSQMMFPGEQQAPTEDVMATRQALMSNVNIPQTTVPDVAAQNRAVMEYLMKTDPAKYAELVSKRTESKPIQIDLKNRVILVDPADPTKIIGSFDKAAEQGQSTQTEIGLGNNFTKDAAPYVGVTQAYRKVEAAAMNPSPAGDISLIFGYMKMLDPTSVVREGEFATAQSAGSVPTTIVALYNQALQGTRLTEGQRQDFLNQSYNLLKSQKDVYEKTIAPRYESLVKSGKLNRENVMFDPFGGMSFANPPSLPTKASKDAGKAPAGVPQNVWEVMTPQERSLWQK